MPRSIRNWWINGRMDGLDTQVSTGPRSKDGGFDLTIKQRHMGAVEQVLTVRGRVIGEDPDDLTLTVENGNGDEVWRYCSRR